MQYYRPGGTQYSGDAMPFSHAGKFHVYYLLDENHHQSLDGLGGHQWAHASTSDFVHWEHHPLALPITADWEGSICTGSVIGGRSVHHDQQLHAFYATRKRDWTQHLGHAVSEDGITFHKTQPNPFASPPAGYSAYHYRDPFVYRMGEGFEMLVTAQIAGFPLDERGGCLVRYTSPDLWHWTFEGPALIPGGEPGVACIPECADYFEWNGWHYLLYGLEGQTHYRIAHSPHGPWIRPPLATLGNRLHAVMKTASFGDRRIGVAWIGTRKENRDDGEIQWGGNLIFRELIQHPDGSLGLGFVAELVPPRGEILHPEFCALTSGVEGNLDDVVLRAPEGQTVAAFTGLPHSFRLRCRVVPTPGCARAHRFGLGLRGMGSYGRNYELVFDPHLRQVRLAREVLPGVTSLDDPFNGVPMVLDVILHDDIVDVCVNNERGDAHCLINRLPELTGDRLFFFCEDGAVAFEHIQITSLK